MLLMLAQLSSAERLLEVTDEQRGLNILQLTEYQATSAKSEVTVQLQLKIPCYVNLMQI